MLHDHRGVLYAKGGSDDIGFLECAPEGEVDERRKWQEFPMEGRVRAIGKFHQSFQISLCFEEY